MSWPWRSDPKTGGASACREQAERNNAPGAKIRLTALDADRDAVPIGRTITFTLPVELDDAEAVIDYRVHYVDANGLRQPKVFKPTRRRLQPGRPTTITRSHRFEHVSIRQIRPVRHTIDVQVNDQVLGALDVNVLAACPD